MPGTIILLYDDQGSVPGINRLEDGAPNADGVYQIPFNHPCVTYVAGCPVGFDARYNCIPGGAGNKLDYWNQYLGLNDANDVVQVRDQKFQLRHALMWWAGKGNRFPDASAPQSVKVAEGSVANRSISFVDDDPNDQSNYTLSTSFTPGWANSTENEAYIDAMKPIVCVGETIALGCQGSEDYCYFWAPEGVVSAGKGGIGYVTAEQDVTVRRTAIDADGNIVGEQTYFVRTHPNFTVTISEQQLKRVNCPQESDFKFTVEVSDEYPEYKLYWPDGQRTATVVLSGDQTYDLTVTSPNGCSRVIPVRGIGDPFLLASVKITASQNSICGGDPTQLRATMQDYLGDSGFSYAWSNGGTGSITQAAIAGEYRVSVTTEAGCTFIDTIHLQEDFSVSILANGTQACAENPIDLIADIYGNDDFIFTYEWSTGETSEAIRISEGGSYGLTVTNEEGCRITDVITIDESVQVELVPEAENIAPGSSVMISASINRGTPPYHYAWSTGATSANLSVTAAGNYGLTITDAFGCQDEAEVSILPFDNEACAGIALAILFQEPDCEFYGSARLESVLPAGFTAASYAWSTGETGPDIFIDNGGVTYGLTVTAANGCQVEETIEVPAFESLNGLTAAADLCSLVDHLEIVSLADEQAILVMEGMTETALQQRLNAIPNVQLEVVAEYDGPQGPIRAVVPFASAENVPDPSIWAGDLFNLPAETPVEVRFQVAGWNYCPLVCSETKQLNNLGATDSVEVVVEENPVITLDDYACGDSFEPDENTANEDPLAILNVGDVVTVNGFPLLVSELAGGSNGTTNSQGIYSGLGIVPLPFNDQTVQVSFTGSFINKNYVLKSGAVEGIQDQLSNYDFSMDTLVIGGDICIPPINEDGFNDEGIDPVEGIDRFGFVDSTGLHSVTGTSWDENGFDVNGNHRETGDSYNADGCNREGRNAEGGECDLRPYVDPTTQAFMDSVEMILDGLTADEIARRIGQAAQLHQQQVQQCGTLRGEINNLISTLEFEQQFIVGDSSQYLNPGLSKHFAQQPEVFPTDAQSRNPQVVQLEQKHVNLYACDVVELLLSDTLTTYQGADAGAVKAYLLLQLSYLSEDSINALKIGDAFVNWIAVQVKNYLKNLLTENNGLGQAENLFPSPAAGFRTPQQRFYNMGTYASADDFLHLGSKEEMIAYELNSQFEQGFRMIQGVHRAHFLSKLAELRAEEEGEGSGGLLPLKVTKYIGGVQYSILLDQMSFDPVNGARTNAYLIIEDPESAQKLVFEATNVSFGVGGAESSRLSLASTVAIRINNATKLILDANRTFAEWDCEGFFGMGVAGKVELCRDFITPLNEQNLEPLPDSIRFALEFETYVTEWLDAVVTVDAGAFAITGHEGVKWQLDSAVVDLSDHYTPQFEPTEGYASPHYTAEGFSPCWRGFYMRNLSATLPNEFSADSAAVTIGVEDVLIDQSGFSGEAYVEGLNLLDLGTGSAGGWPFGIDRFNVKVLHNSFAGGGFGGQMILPVFTDTMRYDARIYRENRYKFTISPDSSLTMDMLLAKATLFPSSKIEIGYDYNGFLAVADLTGNLKFEIPEDASVEMTLPGLYFKEFRVSNRDPYFDSGIWEIRNLGVSMEFGGFAMDISRISPYRGATTREMGIGFDLAIGLGGENLDLAAGGSFGILGELEEINHRQKWKFKEIDLHGLFIDANIKDIVHVRGGLRWYKDDPDYGKGFHGLLEAQFTKKPLDFSASVAGQFGKKGDTKYFFIDAMVGLGSGIPIGPLNINGFGGGVSYHMDNTFDVAAMDFGSAAENPSIPPIGTSFSGTRYTVAPEIGLGLKATVMVATKKKELFNGWAGLEFVFNAPDHGGGLAKVSFKGQGQFMADLIPEPPEFINTLTDQLEEALPIDEVPDLGAQDPVPVSAWIDLTYNFNDNVFDGTLEAYLNAGLIRGAGANGRLVQAAMHVSSEKWYFNIGTPTNPAGILVDLPIFKAGATAYFNMGTDIPDFPGLPSNVASMARLYKSNEGLRKSGGGVMFGARVFADAELKFGPVAAFLEADLGFDLMLRNYGNAICSNTGRNVGINGWYASGQAWVYLNGGVRLLGVPIFEAGLAGILQARLPNPIWAKATLAAQVKLLFVKKNINFNVEIGKRCELLDENGEGVPDNPVINYLNPLDDEQDLAVDVTPQVFFNYSIGRTFDDGAGNQYRTRLSEVSLFSLGGNYALPFDEIWTNGKTVLNVTPHQFFSGEDSIRLSVKVEVLNGNTVERTESQEIVFHTAEAYDDIPLTNVKYSYPINGMYDFYAEEYNRREGFIQLRRGQANILVDLADGEANAILLQAASGEEHLLAMEYDILSRKITFPLNPDQLTRGMVYRLSVVRIQDGEVIKELLAPLHFRVSEFAKFSGKFAEITNSPAFNGPSFFGLGDFSLNLTPAAYLGDAARIGIGELNPLVRMQASMSSSYLRGLNELINDRFPLITAACGRLTYAETTSFEHLRDAAGVSASGSDQSLVAGEDQFSGKPFAGDFSQTAVYQAVTESNDRFRTIKSQVTACVDRHKRYFDELPEEETGGGELEDYLTRELGEEVVSFYNSSFPAAPDVLYYIHVAYVLPNNVTTFSGDLAIPK